MDAKDEIKQKLSVEEVVGDYLELRRSGRNFKAISPFTSERTPSFMVSPEKQIWHDFSSNKGGDIFTFVMEVEGVEFREALEILARKANIDLGQFQKNDNGTSKLKKRILEANKLAVQFYHICLSRKAEALDYIKNNRGYNIETIKTWQLGYSPEDGKSLYSFLIKRGFNELELSKAGLITKRRNGWGDMFRGRIMIPLADGQGNYVGFTARLLKDNPSAPKYFNTPQTLVYDKGRQVFGLHHAKESIRTNDFAVLVEGNLDVIASHQAGVKNVVAAAGTAMTADHLRSLSRLSLNIRLAFDSDKAGVNATERAVSIAEAVGVDIKVIEMPEGAKDPDEVIQKDPDLWKRSVGNYLDAVEWIIKKYQQEYDIKTPDGKRKFSTIVLKVISGLQDPVEKEHHIKKLSQVLDTSVASLLAKISQSASKPNAKKPSKAGFIEADSLAYQDDFLALNCYFPDVRDGLKIIEASAFTTKERLWLFDALKMAATKKRFDVSCIDQKDLNNYQDYVNILTLTAEEKYASFSPADLLAETMALARRIKQIQQTYARKRLTEDIREAEARDDQEGVARLLEEYQRGLKEE
ncbi:DNA primase [Candidatus Nomurabacteria bacterium]|nr:DNA primase [Candidatus Nomurabacteria bacterium]